MAYPEIGWTELRGIWPELSAIDPAIAVHLEIDAKYDVYLKRQTADVDAFRRDEGLMLTDIEYAAVPGLSNEARAKLEAARPRTVGQAGRLDGLTPAALGILAAYLRREARRKSAAATACRLFHVKQGGRLPVIFLAQRALTPTLSRKREREGDSGPSGEGCRAPQSTPRCGRLPLPLAGEGWGEGVSPKAAPSLNRRMRNSA